MRSEATTARPWLFLGLGTRLGSALIIDGILEPMELAHLPFKKRTFEDYLGERGRQRFGKKRVEKVVPEAVEQLTNALEPDYFRQNVEAASFHGRMAPSPRRDTRAGGCPVRCRERRFTTRVRPG
jgi:hypothetical protein